MAFLNVEIKARCADPGFVREYLLSNKGVYKGLDLQTDTYFNVSNGRLKLREGIIENNLIYYERENESGPKNSNFRLTKIDDAKGLKQSLAAAIGVKVIVQKQREIYYIDNVKFHIDDVPGLGTFVEIEAGNILAPALTEKELKKQCEFYMTALKIKEADLLETSYSDLLLEAAT